jgi:hypothetical protein
LFRKDNHENDPRSRLQIFVSTPKSAKAASGALSNKSNHRWGVVFSVSERDLERLDRREGILIGAYIRGPLEVYKQSGEAAQTQTYFAIRQSDNDFTPHRKYTDLYVSGAKRFCLPGDYIKFLEHLRDGAKSD